MQQPSCHTRFGVETFLCGLPSKGNWVTGLGLRKVRQRGEEASRHGDRKGVGSNEEVQAHKTYYKEFLPGPRALQKWCSSFETCLMLGIIVQGSREAFSDAASTMTNRTIRLSIRPKTSLGRDPKAAFLRTYGVKATPSER